MGRDKYPILNRDTDRKKLESDNTNKLRAMILYISSEVYDKNSFDKLLSNVNSDIWKLMGSFIKDKFTQEQDGFIFRINATPSRSQNIPLKTQFSNKESRNAVAKSRVA